MSTTSVRTHIHRRTVEHICKYYALLRIYGPSERTDINFENMIIIHRLLYSNELWPFFFCLIVLYHRYVSSVSYRWLCRLGRTFSAINAFKVEKFKLLLGNKTLTKIYINNFFIIHNFYGTRC